jgi:K+-transporting ATPase ATPase B chain
MTTQPISSHSDKKRTALRRELYRRAALDAFKKLDPRWMVRNPVMFIVEVGSLLTSALWVQALLGRFYRRGGFVALVHRSVRQLR